MKKNRHTSILVRKYSGIEEPFNAETLRKALLKSGAHEEVAAKIVATIEQQLYPGISTREIYKVAYRLLKQNARPTAARFNLKRAIMELGPTGFPFENFIGELLKTQGYKVHVGVIVQGKCVKHEVDVIAEKDNEHFMIECKFHNRVGECSDVKIPLYVHSRFLDVAAEWKNLPGHSDKVRQGWVVTNTRLSDDAIQYGSCAGLRLWSWDYPHGKGIKDFIDQTGLYPLTCLTTLTKHEKAALLSQRVVLCQELCQQPQLLQQLGISAERSARILKEGNELCQTLIQRKRH